MDIEKELIKRFAEAIKKSFEPCPLIGPKWLVRLPEGKSADFRYMGMPKLAKATGKHIESVVKHVIRNLDLSGLNASISVDPEGLVDVKIKPPKE